MTEGVGTFLRRPPKKGRDQRRQPQQGETHIARHQNHALVQRTGDGLHRRAGVTDHPGAHRVARRGHAVNESRRQHGKAQKEPPAPGAALYKQPRQHAGQRTQAEQSAAVASAAQGGHAQKKNGRQPRSAAPAFRPVQPQKQRRAQRHQRINEHIAYAAVEPVERLAHIGHELEHHRQRQGRKNGGLPAFQAQPPAAENRREKEPEAAEERRQQKAAGDPVQFFRKGARLQIAQQSARIGALPGIPGAGSIFQRGLQRRSQIAGLLPHLMRRGGKAEIVIIGVIIPGHSIQRQSAEAQRQQAEGADRPPQAFSHWHPSASLRR